MKQIKLISKFEPRVYQQSIFANSLNKNSLVVLPTGLGKTVIALMLATYYFNQNNKKILFLAPTKPLVEQQKISFEQFIENSDEFNFQVLTGLVSPKKRATLYKEQDFIFSTPQLIENDIINRVLDPNDFGLVIIDEAHRGTGNYAYGFIAQEFDKTYTKILALTASPGTNISQIREVMTNLCINHIEVKRYEDEDVKPYVNKTNIKHIEIELGEELVKIKDLLQKVYNKKLQELKELDLDIKKPLVSKKDLLDLQVALRSRITTGDTDEHVWSAISIAAALMKLSYGQELFESQEIAAAYVYFHNFFRSGGDKSKAAEALTYDIDFRDAYGKIKTLREKNILHPKLEKLKELITLNIHKNKDLKIIVFNQYRESAQKIVEELSKIEDINPVLFVGQAKKGEFKLSQKQQKEVIQNFRDARHNVLVSTSVGEEGLDIPKVDLVIFYEPVPSAIRTIQRVGRTGRFNEGNAFILQSLGTRDMITRHVANAKEKSMYKALDKIKSEGLGKTESPGKTGNKGLAEFINNKQQEENKNEMNMFDLLLHKKNLKIGIDIDDTIAEVWRKEILENYNKKYKKNITLNDIKSHNFNGDENLKKEFFDFHYKNITKHKLFPKAKEIILKLLERGDEIFFITSRPNLDEKDTRIWFDLNFGDIFKDNIHFTFQYNDPCKSIPVKTLGIDILIDDAPHHIENVSKEKKLVLMYNQPWNENINEGDYKKRVRSWEEIENYFFKKKEVESTISKQMNSKIPIYVDQRENTDLIKEIYSIEELEVHSKQLDVGDIVINENIAIERKAKIDFVNSIIDKRLFPQLMDLARNFRRPILILEGEENIFTLRNLNPNVIRATLSAIAVDLRIPILVTNNMQETAQMIRTIAKRTIKEKKEISLVSDKKSHSENEEMEKFVSSIPKINVVNAKGLLKHFKSLNELINASEKELLEVQGIGPGRAKFLKDFFEREYQL